MKGKGGGRVFALSEFRVSDLRHYTEEVIKLDFVFLPSLLLFSSSPLLFTYCQGPWSQPAVGK